MEANTSVKIIIISRHSGSVYKNGPRLRLYAEGIFERIDLLMHKKTHQFNVKRRRPYTIAGVTVPALPYYYLWYGSGYMAPYGGPGGSNETAQNNFGKDSNDGTGAGEAGDGGGSST
jgi:hypothetical protein